MSTEGHVEVESCVMHRTLLVHCTCSSKHRYNDFQHDPLSACNCTPPYSAENGISARCDLNPVNGTYPFGALGHRCHGGTDNKVGKHMSHCPLLLSFATPSCTHRW